MMIPVRVLMPARWTQVYTVSCLRMIRYPQMKQISSTVSASGPGLPVQSSSEPCLSPNVKRYSSSITLYSDPSMKDSDRSSRPLLLFLPWLGSKARAFEKYIQLYFKLGFDVLVAESSLSHFLWPRRGLTYAEQLLDLLIREKELCSRSLFVHAVSIGGYTFAQMLVSTSKGTEKRKKAMERFHGQVYDSLVIGSMENMAKGVAGMVSSRVLQSLVVSGTLFYFAVLKSQTSDYYENAIQIFRNTPITCPALLFYCMNDSLSDHVAVEKLVADWEKNGIKVQSKKWKESAHAGHLRRHPQEYTETLNTFIRSLQSSIPRSKL